MLILRELITTIMIKTLPLIITLSCVAAQEAKHVMTTAGAGIPESADFSVKPMGYEFGLTYSFIIEGENIVLIKEDSLKTESQGWKMGPFAKIQDDGAIGSFSIKKKGNYLGKEFDEKVNGTVTIVTGSSTETKTFILKNKAKPVQAGGLKFSLNLGGNNFMGGKGVKVVGDFNKIKSVELNQGDKKVESNGSSWDNKSKTFSFSDIKDGAEVTVTWWTDLAEKEVAFSKD